MKIRLARKEDIQAICRIYDLAREHMRAEGNTSQWKKYPNEKDAYNKGCLRHRWLKFFP